MARGLGAFFSGVAEGYQTGKKLNAMAAQEQRDKERMLIEKERAALEGKRFTLEEERAKRDADQFGMTKQLTQQQIEAGAIDLAQRKRDQAFQDDMKAAFSELQALSQGGIEGDVVTPQGVASGRRRFASVEQANQALGKEGLTFVPGSVKEAKPMDPIDFQRRAADVWKLVNAKHGKVDLKMLTESRKFDREIEQEGAIKAMQYALTNPSDQKGIRERFNKQGNVKLGDDVQIGIRNDAVMGPVVFGYRVGKDGKQELVFDGFEDIILPSMGPEAYAAAKSQFKQLAIKEKGDNDRTDKNNATAKETTQMNNDTSKANTASNNQTAITTTSMNNKAAMDRELIQAQVRKKSEKDPVYGQLEDLIMGQGKAAISNPSNAMNIDTYTQENLDTLNYAYALIKDGKASSVPDAAAKATAAVRAARNQPKK
jgi:hypothetical protein